MPPSKHPSLNVTPTIAIDDENQTISISMEITEDTRYRWGNVRVIGLDPKIVAFSAVISMRIAKSPYPEERSSDRENHSD